MNLSVGIVGLPNVGKSTFFNMLLRARGQMRNMGHRRFPVFLLLTRDKIEKV